MKRVDCNNLPVAKASPKGVDYLADTPKQEIIFISII